MMDNTVKFFTIGNGGKYHIPHNLTHSTCGIAPLDRKSGIPCGDIPDELICKKCKSMLHD